MATQTMEPIAFIRKHLETAEPDLLRELLHDVVEALMPSGAGSCARSELPVP